MKKIVFGALPFVCMFLIMVFINKAKPTQRLREHSITVQQGLLTLPSHNDADVFNITGLWHFTPNQFYCFRNSAQPQYAPLPGKLSDTSLQSDYGYASYGLHIVGLNPNKIYALRTSYILSSSTIVINGFDRVGQGQPGVSANTEIPGKAINVAVFKPLKNGTADIIINISNFHNRYGGTDRTILLGTAEKLNGLFVFDLLFYNLACIVLFVFSMFFIALYFNYQRIPYILWFALTALILSIRIASFYPHIIVHVWPSIPWKLYFILRYASIPLSVLFFTIFIRKIFDSQYKFIYRGIIALCIIASISIFIASTALVSRHLYIQQTIIFIAALYNIVIIVRAFIQKQQHALWIAAITGLLAGFAVYDILVSQWIISGRLLLQDGAVVAILIAVIMSINRYVSSIDQIECLVVEQKKIQAALQRFFPNQLLFFLQKNNITEINTGDSSELPMTVLSIDIRSFTSISEQLTPDEVFILLNRYFALVAPIIRKHGGVIMKFLGDGFTALFAENPDFAVLCGIEIQKKLQEEKIQLRNLPPIKAGIGIDTGKILLGVIGNDNRLDSMIISDACYTAEELQTATKVYSNTLIISEAIFCLLQNPEDYHIRCIREISPSGSKSRVKKTTVLYEVYDCDIPSVQEKKQKTSSYIEKAVEKIQEKNYAGAHTYLSRALDVFPNDPLALYYQKVIRKLI